VGDRLAATGATASRSRRLGLPGHAARPGVRRGGAARPGVCREPGRAARRAWPGWGLAGRRCGGAGGAGAHRGPGGPGGLGALWPRGPGGRGPGNAGVSKGRNRQSRSPGQLIPGQLMPGQRRLGRLVPEFGRLVPVLSLLRWSRCSSAVAPLWSVITQTWQIPVRTRDLRYTPRTHVHSDATEENDDLSGVWMGVLEQDRRQACRAPGRGPCWSGCLASRSPTG
jgi:hypothetical protein